MGGVKGVKCVYNVYVKECNLSIYEGGGYHEKLLALSFDLLLLLRLVVYSLRK